LTELKLTNVARASLEELRLDYEDFLRHRRLEKWEPEHPALKRFKARRCATIEEVRAWVREERKRARTDTDKHRHNPRWRMPGRIRSALLPCCESEKFYCLRS
jgi:hypothetical protein